MAQLVWHQREIENILRSVERGALVTARATNTGDEMATAYVLGVIETVATIATAFGIPVANSVHSSLPAQLPSGERYQR